jgi:hypothetical protein
LRGDREALAVTRVRPGAASDLPKALQSNAGSLLIRLQATAGLGGIARLRDSLTVQAPNRVSSNVAWRERLAGRSYFPRPGRLITVPLRRGTGNSALHVVAADSLALAGELDIVRIGIVAV